MGLSPNQAQALIEKLARETLPNGITFEWTDLTYQQILAGNTAILVFPLCVLLVFLVLAALYESWTLPLAVILIVPMCLLCAIAGVWFTGNDNNIFTQIGFIVLVGLACKNAILIVEFARELEMQGRDVVGVAVFAGMLGVTLFGLLLTPMFYVLLRSRRSKAVAAEPALLRSHKVG